MMFGGERISREEHFLIGNKRECATLRQQINDDGDWGADLMREKRNKQTNKGKRDNGERTNKNVKGMSG